MESKWLKISFLFSAKWLDSTKIRRTIRIHWQCSHWDGGCMNASDEYDLCCHQQDNVILPAPPVGGLPISQDWLDRMKCVRNSTIPIILPSGKNILVDTMFKIKGTPTLACGNSNTFLAAESALSLPPIPVWLGTQQKIMSLLSKFKRHTFVSPI